MAIFHRSLDQSANSPIACRARDWQTTAASCLTCAKHLGRSHLHHSKSRLLSRQMRHAAFNFVEEVLRVSTHNLLQTHTHTHPPPKEFARRLPARRWSSSALVEAPSVQLSARFEMPILGKQVHGSLHHRAAQVRRHPPENVWLMVDLHHGRHEPLVPSCIAAPSFCSVYPSVCWST